MRISLYFDQILELQTFSLVLYTVWCGEAEFAEKINLFRKINLFMKHRLPGIRKFEDHSHAENMHRNHVCSQQVPNPLQLQEKNEKKST